MIAASDKVAAAILRNGLPDMLFHALLGPDSQSRGHPYSCHRQWKCQCECECECECECVCVCVSGGRHCKNRGVLEKIKSISFFGSLSQIGRASCRERVSILA